MTSHGRGLRTSGLALAFATAFATGCYSQPAPTAPPASGAPAADDPCAGSADEAAMLRCHQGEFHKAEGAMRAVLAKLVENAREDDPERAQALARAHEAWARSREADCVVDTWDSRGGTAFEVYRLDCVTTAAKGRLAYLKALAAAP